MTPLQPFFNTPESRIALARQRFFERGERPTGLVSEPVIQSWARCLQQRQDPEQAVSFQPVTASRVHGVLRRNRLLLQVAAAEMRELGDALAGTSAGALLVDTQGVVMHSTWQRPLAEAPLMNIAARVGVDLSEAAVGTTAPGVVLRCGQPVRVAGAEHFAQDVRRMQCAAAPVRDGLGRLVAVLDLSIEGRTFGFDAAMLVERYARGIENRLLQALAHEQLVVQLQVDAALLAGPWAALVGVGEDGRVAWLNGAAAALLGQDSMWSAPIGLEAEALLGLSLTALRVACEAAVPQRLHLPSGLGVWCRCRRVGEASFDETPVGLAPAAAAVAPSSPPDGPQTLHDADRELVRRTLRECGGNVSQAARRLRVSRGLVYRHLRAVADGEAG
jgi:transcriptional regulator of acetoin/glycerol metabolism